MEYARDVYVEVSQGLNSLWEEDSWVGTETSSHPGVHLGLTDERNSNSSLSNNCIFINSSKIIRQDFFFFPLTFKAFQDTSIF